MVEIKSDTRLLLDNIRSVHNAGSIFRTADTLGISHIYCLGTTPTPTDRFGRKRQDFTKVSLGAEYTVSWEHLENAADAISLLNREGYQVISLEQSPESVDYKDIEINTGIENSKTLIILGNEVDGVSKDLLESSDIIAEIPMRGEKESLNVSVATAVFLYRLLDK